MWFLVVCLFQGLIKELHTLCGVLYKLLSAWFGVYNLMIGSLHPHDSSPLGGTSLWYWFCAHLPTAHPIHQFYQLAQVGKKSFRLYYFCHLVGNLQVKSLVVYSGSHSEKAPSTPIHPPTRPSPSRQPRSTSWGNFSPTNSHFTAVVVYCTLFFPLPPIPI